MQQHLRWLSDLPSGGHAEYGQKANSLAKLRAAGFPVPNGFCITAQAYREQLTLM